MELAIMVPVRPIPTATVPKIAPTEQQWNYHRDCIQQLYIVQGKTLKETMRLMSQQHGLCATVKMWKLRLSKWQFTKHNNLKDMRAVACQMVEAGSNVGNLSFEIKGKAVAIEEVIRYFRRKGFKAIEDAIQHTSSMSISEPSLYDPPTAPKTLYSCSLNNVEAPELVFKMIQVYYNGCFDTGKWYSNIEDCVVSREATSLTQSELSLFDFYWKSVLCFVQAKQHDEYRHALSKICEVIPVILRAEHPDTVRVFLEMLLEFSRAGLHHFAALILNHINNESSPHHPLAIICRQLLRVEVDITINVAFAALRCGVDSLAESFGTQHYGVICCRTALVMKTYTTSGDHGDFSRQSHQILSNSISPILLRRLVTAKSPAGSSKDTMQNFCFSMEDLPALSRCKNDLVAVYFNIFVFELRLRSQHEEAEMLEAWAAKA